MNCGVGRRSSSDPVLLWLWRRPVATGPIRPLAWEPPCAAGAALKKDKRQKKKKIEGRQQTGDHTARLHRDRETETERQGSDLGFCLFWGEGGVPGVLQVHLYW